MQLPGWKGNQKRRLSIAAVLEIFRVGYTIIVESTTRCDMLSRCVIQHPWLYINWCAQRFVERNVLTLLVAVMLSKIACICSNLAVVIESRAAETRTYLKRSSLATNIPKPGTHMLWALKPYIAVHPIIEGAERPQIVVSVALVHTAATPAFRQL